MRPLAHVDAAPVAVAVVPVPMSTAPSPAAVDAAQYSIPAPSATKSGLALTTAYPHSISTTLNMRTSAPTAFAMRKSATIVAVPHANASLGVTDAGPR